MLLEADRTTPLPAGGDPREGAAVAAQLVPPPPTDLAVAVPVTRWVAWSTDGSRSLERPPDRPRGAPAGAPPWSWISRPRYSDGSPGGPSVTRLSLHGDSAVAQGLPLDLDPELPMRVPPRSEVRMSSTASPELGRDPLADDPREA